MKKLLFLLFTGALFISCEGDDASVSNDSYFSLQTGNSWEYEVDVEGTSTIDILTVTSETEAGFTMDVEPALPAAIMSNVLSNAVLRQENGKLIGTGALTFDLFGLDDLDFTVENAALYDQNASQGSQLTTVDGSLSRPVQGFDLNIDYTATTFQQEALENLTVNGVEYMDVLHSQLIINVEIGTVASFGGFDIPVVILPSQDVIVVDNYWAKDIGLIRSNSDFNYELSDFSGLGVDLPLPQEADILTTQNLVAFIDGEEG